MDAITIPRCGLLRFLRCGFARLLSFCCSLLIVLHQFGIRAKTSTPSGVFFLAICFLHLPKKGTGKKNEEQESLLSDAISGRQSHSSHINRTHHITQHIQPSVYPVFPLSFTHNQPIRSPAHCPRLRTNPLQLNYSQPTTQNPIPAHPIPACYRSCSPSLQAH